MKLLTLAFSFFSVLILSSSMSLTRTDATIGSEAPEFAIYNEESSVKTSDLKGKCITINFWSVKDAVSRERNARLSREAAQEGKEYIGICVDDDRELASEIIAQDGLESENQFMASDVKNGNPTRSYQIHSGLRAFEVNPYGNISRIIE